MLNEKLTVLLGLTTLVLAGCPAEDDNGDTGAMTMTSPVSDTNETEDPTSDSADPTGDPTGEPETTTGPDETTGTPDPMTTTGDDECTPDDECQSPADCPNPTTDMCVACFCVSGEESGGGACEAGMCSMCGDCMECQMCAQSPGGECEAALMTCSMNPACVAAVMCANMCMDAACQMACIEDNPDGADDFNALIGCLFAPGSGVCLDACS